MCRQVRQWLTQNVLIPVTQFLTEAREKCEEAREWVEEEVEQPVERWISRQEERCRELPWWNPVRWFCEIVTVVVKSVVWVLVTVGKWAVTLACRIVTTIVGAIVTLVLTAVTSLVTVVVCIGSDFFGALKAVGDLWQSVLRVVELFFELFDILLAAAIGILNDLENLIDSVASSLGWLGVVLGPVKGMIQLAREWVSIGRDVVRGARDILLGILNLNTCRILRGAADLGTAAGRALVSTAVLPLRTITASGAGIRDEVHQILLERVIRDRVNAAFGARSPRARRALAKIALYARPMGLPFRVDARRLFLRSNHPELSLRALHDAGRIDLWALAGYRSGCAGLLDEPDGEVVYAGTDLRVSASDIEIFLREGAGAVPEFHVFPLTRTKFREHLEVANRKAAALGVRLFYRTIGAIEATSPDHVPLRADENDAAVQDLLFTRMGRTGVNDDLSVIPVISVFAYVRRARDNTQPFGLMSSGVTYRNRPPDWAFRFVLAHEIGHYLAQPGSHKNRAGNDRGLDEIMYAPSTEVGVTGSALLEYGLLTGEPRFTLDDARTTWDWITGDGAASLLP